MNKKGLDALALIRDRYHNLDICEEIALLRAQNHVIPPAFATNHLRYTFQMIQKTCLNYGQFG